MAKRNPHFGEIKWRIVDGVPEIEWIKIHARVSLADPVFPDEFKTRYYVLSRKEAEDANDTATLQFMDQAHTKLVQAMKNKESMPDGS